MQGKYSISLGWVILKQGFSRKVGPGFAQENIYGFVTIEIIHQIKSG